MCNFSQVQYKLPDDGRRPKHVAAILMCIWMQILKFWNRFINIFAHSYRLTRLTEFGILKKEYGTYRYNFDIFQSG